MSKEDTCCENCKKICELNDMFNESLCHKCNNYFNQINLNESITQGRTPPNTLRRAINFWNLNEIANSDETIYLHRS